MYDYFSGKVAELNPTYAVIDAGGVGYALQISLVTYGKLKLDMPAKLFAHLAVNTISNETYLYGFFDKSEREIFRLLISVSGVGANTARVMLSSMEPGELKKAIETGDLRKIKSVKGIGEKTAQRIIVDLQDKIAKTEIETADGSTYISANRASDEAIAALVMLGFVKKNAEKAIESVLKEQPAADIETLVKLALKRL
jgi:Holliday junction DNA helicase RuvA